MKIYIGMVVASNAISLGEVLGEGYFSCIHAVTRVILEELPLIVSPADFLIGTSPADSSGGTSLADSSTSTADVVASVVEVAVDIAMCVKTGSMTPDNSAGLASNESIGLTPTNLARDHGSVERNLNHESIGLTPTRLTPKKSAGLTLDSTTPTPADNELAGLVLKGPVLN